MYTDVPLFQEDEEEEEECFFEKYDTQAKIVSYRGEEGQACCFEKGLSLIVLDTFSVHIYPTFDIRQVDSQAQTICTMLMRDIERKEDELRWMNKIKFWKT